MEVQQILLQCIADVPFSIHFFFSSILRKYYWLLRIKISIGLFFWAVSPFVEMLMFPSGRNSIFISKKGNFLFTFTLFYVSMYLVKIGT